MSHVQGFSAMAAGSAHHLVIVVVVVVVVVCAVVCVGEGVSLCRGLKLFSKNVVVVKHRNSVTLWNKSDNISVLSK